MENYEEKYNKYLGNIEKKEKSSFRRLIILSSIPVLLAILFTVYSMQTVEEKEQIIISKNNEISSKDKVYKELSEDVLKTLNELSDSTKVQLDSLTRQKVLSTENKVRNLPRVIFDENQTVVRYYKRNQDDIEIGKIIRQMGFYLNIRPVDDDVNVKKANTIFYGDSVKVTEVELLAKELIKTNNSFRGLINYDLSEDYKWKIRAIEIGYDKKYDSLKPLNDALIESKLRELTNAKTP